MSSIYFGGSRSLSAPSPIIAQAVLSVIMSGSKIHVGCCVGADALVIASALLMRPPSLVVFAISSQSGQGGCSLSSGLPSVVPSQGGRVAWLAGGALSVPLAGRLIQRSRAALAGCSAAVFFEPGPGSLAVAAHAVSQMPVFAFGDKPASIPGCAGQWVAAEFSGFACWSWQSAQLSLL